MQPTPVLPHPSRISHRFTHDGERHQEGRLSKYVEQRMLATVIGLGIVYTKEFSTTIEVGESTVDEPICSRIYTEHVWVDRRCRNTIILDPEPWLLFPHVRVIRNSSRTSLFFVPSQHACDAMSIRLLKHVTSCILQYEYENCDGTLIPLPKVILRLSTVLFSFPFPTHSFLPNPLPFSKMKWPYTDVALARQNMKREGHRPRGKSLTKRASLSEICGSSVS